MRFVASRNLPASFARFVVVILPCAGPLFARCAGSPNGDAAGAFPDPDGRKDEVKTADEKARLPQRALQFGTQWSSHPPRKPARRSPFTI